MVLRQLNRQHAIWFCLGMVLMLGRSGTAGDLLNFHLNQVAPGQFPAQHWYPADRPSIINEREAMLELMEMLSSLDGAAIEEIKTAHADRSVLVRDLGLPKLKARIDRICASHRPILNQVKQIEWSNASPEMVSLEVSEQRYQIQALGYLVHLGAVREFAEGRFESASQTLAGGYAFAHNLMRTSGDLNMILGITLQSVMTGALADMQSLGAPDMQIVLSRISASQIDQATQDHLQWIDVCRTMPVLNDRQRNPKDWQADLEATLKTFHRSDLMPQSLDDAEQLGRQIQTIVQAMDRVKALNIAVEYKHGGTSEARNLESGQRLLQTTTMNIAAFAKYVDQTLDDRIIDRAKHDLGQRLWGLHCVECLRLESVKRGHWITKIDTAFLNAIPSRRGATQKPTIKISLGMNKLPFYEIHFPEQNFLSGFFRSPDDTPMIAVRIAQDIPQ